MHVKLKICQYVTNDDNIMFMWFNFGNCERSSSWFVKYNYMGKKFKERHEIQGDMSGRRHALTT
jgi:hypothetical protein